MRLLISSRLLLLATLFFALFPLYSSAQEGYPMEDSTIMMEDSTIRYSFEPISAPLYSDIIGRPLDLTLDALPEISASSLHKTSMSRDTRRIKRYHDRLDRYQKGWSALTPRYTKLQFAGNMGLLSFGFGWNYGRANQWETDMFLGFIPKFATSKFKITSTIKQNYIPWSVSLGRGSFSIDPLSCSIYFNSVWGRDFWANNPGKYPSGYYTFATKVRANIAVGQRFTYNVPHSYRHSFKSITFFYEIGTCDLYLMSAANRYLKAWDYLGLSFGLKLQIL